MDRFEKLDATLQMRTIDGQNTAVFAPSSAAMGQLCIDLSLLWHQLVTRLVLECAERQHLTIGVDEKFGASTGAVGVWSPPSIRLTMSRTELERWLVFALKYCRDGMGEVDHIDLEARDSPNGERETVFVTFKVPTAKEPLSQEELRKLLRMK